MKLADRINQLMQSGLGFSAQDIAAILDLDTAHVTSFMADESQIPLSGVQTIFVQGDQHVTAHAFIPFSGVTIDDDTGDAVVAPGIPALFLPKGYYMGVLSAQVQGVPGDTPTDEWTFLAAVAAGGFNPLKVVNAFGSIHGTAAEIARGFVTVPFAFESGEDDLAVVTVQPQHGYASLQCQAVLHNDTTDVNNTTAALTLADFQTYIQRIGSKN